MSEPSHPVTPPSPGIEPAPVPREIPDAPPREPPSPEIDPGSTPQEIPDGVPDPGEGGPPLVA